VSFVVVAAVMTMSLVTSRFWKVFWSIALFLKGFRRVSNRADLMLSELFDRWVFENVSNFELCYRTEHTFVTLHFITFKNLRKYRFASVSWSPFPTLLSLCDRSTRIFFTKPRLNERDLELVYFEEILCK